ncbi:MAG TPA: helix-turn-helix domain-containing protein [Acidimicrobiales bacterium]|nr:helix-turn-helix domain-containing protein [Acidimicrobiales bacterium]
MDTSQRTHQEPLAYGIDDACVATGLSRPTLYRLMASGAIPYRQCGARRLILAADLQRWLKSLPEGAA